jgi:hypothetical protein
VSLFRKIVLVALVTLWVPATSHCLLVALSGMESLACCADEQAAPAPQDDTCKTDGCSVVESGLYKTELNHVSIPQPALALVMFDGWDPWGRPSLMASPAAASGLPLDFAPSRHFRTRTALPARAPDAHA